MSLYRGPSVIGTSTDTTHAMVLSATAAAITAANEANAARTAQLGVTAAKDAAASSALAAAASAASIAGGPVASIAGLAGTVTGGALKAALSLEAVNNTPDLSKPVSTAVQTALDTKVTRTSATGSAVLSAGTTAQRDATPVAGAVRFNSTLNQYEGYNGTVWGALGGGATGAPGNSVFMENDQIVTASYTLTSGKNAISAGPITIADGVLVTIPTGATWSIT